jgi:peptidoglycan/xylan/chitin deacetylase (PgdA/CDA1 family)
VRVDVRSAAARDRAQRLCVEALFRFDLASIDAVIDQIERQVGVKAKPCAAHRRLGREDVRALHDEGFVDIGAHGRTHESLAALSDEDSRRDLEDCRNTLERVAGHAPRVVAYPFGVPETIRRRHFRHARELGFELGFTTTPSAYRRPWFRFQLPRVAVMDWPRDEFAARVSSLLG